MTCPVPDPDKLAEEIRSSDKWTIIYAYYGDDGRWNRDVEQNIDPGELPANTADDVLAHFWLTNGPEWYDRIRVVAVLQGLVPTVDQAQYATEPRFDPQVLDQYDRRVRKGEATSMFTVYGLWNNGQPDFVPTIVEVDAIDWIHAELIVREGRQAGRFLIAGTVAKRFFNHMPRDLYPFGTHNGRPKGEVQSIGFDAPLATTVRREVDVPSRPGWLVPAALGAFLALVALLMILL